MANSAAGGAGDYARTKEDRVVSKQSRAFIAARRRLPAPSHDKRQDGHGGSRTNQRQTTKGREP
jgi:hypothetical protein